MLTKKGQHVEQLIGFGQKPKLFARFQERMGEYKHFWEGVQNLCKNYIHGANGTSTSGGSGAGAGGSDKAGGNPNPRSNVNRRNSAGSEDFGDFLDTHSHPSHSHSDGSSHDRVFRDFEEFSRGPTHSLGPDDDPL